MGRLRVALSGPRLDRYLTVARGNQGLAFRTSVWNAELAASFLLPLHFAEVCLRNRLHDGLTNIYRPDWHMSGPVRANLDARYVGILTESEKSSRGRHGASWTINNLVAELPFGFWVHLMRPKASGIIWRSSLGAVFPHVPGTVSDREIFDLADLIRHFRNRVAHHKPLFDHSPTRIYADVLTLVGWCCEDTRWTVQQLSRVSQTIARRPRE